MKCSEIQYKLAEKHSRIRDERIRKHLEDCPECREFYRSIKEIDDLSRELRCQYRAPEDLLGRVLAEYQEKSSGGWFSFRSVVVSFFLVAYMLGAFVTWDQMGNGGEITRALLNNDRAAETPRTVPAPGPAPLAVEENSYVEVVIDSAHDEELILRLPPVIEIHRTEIPDDETHYQTVSY